MEPKYYVIFNVSELNKIDFEQVFETSIETVRKSVDGTLRFVKYRDEAMPSSVVSSENKVGTCSQTELFVIIAPPEWNDFPDPIK